MGDSNTTFSVTEDGSRSSLPKTHVEKKPSKPDYFTSSIATRPILGLCRRQGYSGLAFAGLGDGSTAKREDIFHSERQVSGSPAQLTLSMKSEGEEEAPPEA